MKIAIIGAGASGMAAAITAARSGSNQVLLFEQIPSIQEYHFDNLKPYNLNNSSDILNILNTE